MNVYEIARKLQYLKDTDWTKFKQLVEKSGILEPLKDPY